MKIPEYLLNHPLVNNATWMHNRLAACIKSIDIADESYPGFFRMGKIYLFSPCIGMEAQIFVFNSNAKNRWREEKGHWVMISTTTFKKHFCEIENS
jgi:hypothetical protein